MTRLNPGRGFFSYRFWQCFGNKIGRVRRYSALPPPLPVHLFLDLARSVVNLIPPTKVSKILPRNCKPLFFIDTLPAARNVLSLRTANRIVVRFSLYSIDPRIKKWRLAHGTR